jgi:predicted amidohydrolase YtcJ
MGSEIPRQPDTATPAHQPEAGTTGHADMVIKAVIHAMVSARETDARSYRAIAVRDGHILALTAEPDGADDLIGAGTMVIDEPGLTILPTCDDTHTHLIFAGRAANDVQVADARNLGEFLDLIARRAATTPDGQWIRTASNWHELQLAEPRMPTLQELDSAAPDNPVLVKRGGHNDLVNSAGLRLAGVTAQTRAPVGGVIGRDTTGEPTGRFEDSAIALVEQLLPAPSFGEQVEGLRQASAGYAAHRHRRGPGRGRQPERDRAVAGRPRARCPRRAGPGHGDRRVRGPQTGHERVPGPACRRRDPAR